MRRSFVLGVCVAVCGWVVGLPGETKASPDLSQAEMNAAVNRLVKGFYFQPHVMARLLGQSWKRPSLLSSYWTGFVMLLRYLNKGAGIVEKK